MGVNLNTVLRVGQQSFRWFEGSSSIAAKASRVGALAIGALSVSLGAVMLGTAVIPLYCSNSQDRWKILGSKRFCGLIALNVVSNAAAFRYGNRPIHLLVSAVQLGFVFAGFRATLPQSN